MQNVRVAFGAVVLSILNPTDKLVGYFTEIRSFEDVQSDESIRVLIGSTSPPNGTVYKNRKKFVIPSLFPDVLQILFHYLPLSYVSNLYVVNA